MQKIVSTILFVFLMNILPLIFKPELLWQFKPVVILLAAISMFLTQPAFNMQEVKENKSTDRYSIIIILLTSLISVSSSLVEWGYFSNRHSNNIITAIGLLMIAGGLFTRISSIITLGKYFTATARATNKHVLIQSGPYAIVRHPSYSGAILVILGAPVLLNNVFTFFSTIILLAIAYSIRIKNEESLLINMFGEAYLQYSNRVKKIVPYIW